MKILTQTLILMCALFLPIYVAHADSAAEFDVLKSMSVADFRATGLDKLTDAQIKALDAWIADYEQTHAPKCAPVAAIPQPGTADVHRKVTSIAPAEGTIIAHLLGTFRGWNGGTIFKLDNGQVWEQADDSILTVGGVTDPKVTISRGMLDSYYLSVEGVQDEVLVRRIKP